MVDKARNDLSAAVPKFCLALEEHRRTPDGRVRTSQELLTSFFSHDEHVCADRVFKYLPNEVRGPIVAAWGIRGIKAALRDTDDKIQSVVHDALVAGDVDHVAFEDGLAPETLVRWVPLADLWSFWRGGKLTKQALHKALSTAFDLYLFDARWFLETLQAKGGSLRGTDVLAEGLTKDDLTQWIHRIHETGDGSPKGVVAALGWDKIVTKTANDVLVAVLDAMVAKVGLVVASPRESGTRMTDASSKDPKAADGPAAVAPGASSSAVAGPSMPAAPAPGMTSGVSTSHGEESAGANADQTSEHAVVAAPNGSPTVDGSTDSESWSEPPDAAETSPPASTDDPISVVVDEELLIAAAQPPTARRIPLPPPLPHDHEEEDTEVKHAPRARVERASARGPSSRR